MDKSVEEMIEWEEVDAKSALWYRGTLEEYAEEHDLEMLDLCATICFNGEYVGMVDETTDNSISLRAVDKPHKYRTILKELNKNYTPSEISKAIGVGESYLRSELRSFNLLGRGRVPWDVPSSWKEAQSNCIERDEECVVCGATEKLEAHHIIPRKVFDEKRNADSLDNLVSLCNTCHGRHEASPRELFFEAYVR